MGTDQQDLQYINKTLNIHPYLRFMYVTYVT